MHYPEQTQPLPSAIEAAVSLSIDPDPKIAARCRAQVLRWGAAALPVLEKAMAAADLRLRRSARELHQALLLRLWLGRVEDFARASRSLSPSDLTDATALETGALLLSTVGSADAGAIVAARSSMLQMAAELRPRVRGRTAAGCARAIGALLAGERGYSNARTSYYGLDSVRFDEVVRRGRGPAVSLAILYVIVGRRAGLRMSGVAMPDKYLIRVHGTRPVLVDPTQAGATLTKGDCIRYLRVRGYTGNFPSCLEDLGDRQLLRSMLDSLRRVYGYREDVDSLNALRRAAELLADV